ncbi:hypothetical protein H9W90_03970 [Polaribacter pectinis]|uniref:Uncharacterized protein n=1 Tax=Polaribacter pectinis TaxID=2738844 RepID=A0A7G9LCD8_9FLAO|nr:hypothetical protein [Polaribacter pectinis]QNM86287.1 hypothetical protein H9W90_03970 [Polaribacter pectinis]
MKIKILIIVLYCISISNINSQENQELLNSRIVLSIVMPQNEEKITTSNFVKIKSKIKQIISKNDVAATDYYSDFLIYPSIEIYDEETIDAGLQPITIISGDFTLFVKQASTNNQFGSISVKFKGSGNSRSKAIKNGVSKINSNHNDFQTFLKNVKSKIVNYYQKNCNLYVSEADKLNASKQYEQALLKLLSIPAGVTNCNSKINSRIVQYYRNYSNSVCDKKIVIANGYYSEKNYSKSLDILRTIDPESKCKSAALSLMKKIESKIDKEDKQALDITMKIYNDKVSMEKARIASIKEITLAYYKNQPDTNIHVIR